MRAREGPESVRLGSALSAEEIELLRQRAARYAPAAEETTQDVAWAVVFRRGEARYGFPLASLREVRPLRSFCRIPLASPAVPGILHFRGEILSLHDIAGFMDPARASSLGAASWVIVVEHAGERMGLLADEVIDIERHSAAQISAMPITLGDRAAICDGVLPGGLLLLSASRMFHTDGFFSAF